MFIKFSKFKARYDKGGQIFPFLLALLCVVIIFAMITVNLGQIGIFRTDVSNAADAGALAGAGILSGTLLGLGMESDSIAGYSIACIVGIIAIFMAGGFWAMMMAIAVAASYTVKMWTQMKKANATTRMGWANAKKTAMQYAFNNIGVDEPRPSFTSFLRNAYKMSDSAIKQLDTNTRIERYNEYLAGETARARLFAAPGFSRFMGGFNRWYDQEIQRAEMEPGMRVAARTLRAGYGWTQLATGEIEDSYSDPNRTTACLTDAFMCGDYDGTRDTYRDFENWVEVSVESRAQDYALAPWTFPNYILVPAAAAVGIATGIMSYPQNIAAAVILLAPCTPWCAPAIPALAYVFCVICGAIAAAAVYSISFGFTMRNGIDSETTNNPITVTARRYKRPMNLGLWNFRYGRGTRGAIESKSRAHAFREKKNEDITPVLLQSLGNLLTGGGGGDFDTKMHLFETKLIPAQ